MSHFFSVYKALEGMETAPGEVQGRPEAIISIRKVRNAYRALFG